MPHALKSNFTVFKHLGWLGVVMSTLRFPIISLIQHCLQIRSLALLFTLLETTVSCQSMVKQNVTESLACARDSAKVLDMLPSFCPLTLSMRVVCIYWNIVTKTL